MTAILGINCFKHDAAAALLIDGVLVGATEEERFSRRKHDAGYPEEAINYLLEQADLKPSDIDHVAYYMRPDQVRKETIRALPGYLSRKGSIKFFLGQLSGSVKMGSIPGRMQEHLGDSFSPEFHFIDHHECHAWSAWFGAGCRNAAVLTMDGAGEKHSCLVGSITGGVLTEYRRTHLPVSPGLFYSAVTRYLGFTPDNDEYKVMGLSSYGKPVYLDLFRRIISAEDGRFLIDSKLLDVSMGVHHAVFSPEVLSILGEPRDPGDGEPTERHENIAASAQRAIEEAGLAVVKYLRKQTDHDLLVIAGGVALNCVMNGLFEREGGFQEIYPFPAPNDAGTSVGAAVAVHRIVSPDTLLQKLETMYLGSGFSTDEILTDIEMAKLSPLQPENLAETVAEMISHGLVVAVYQGRTEFGPRALGNRSILADPRRAEMKDIVNGVVKHREGFRPFAPACIQEDAGKYFLGCVKSSHMIKTYPVVEGMASVIPAVTHVDNTARVQTVTREENAFYYDIIKEFGKITGVSVVLNTSFNIRGEPIVNTPIDAVRCYYGTGIDALVMPPFLFVKKPAHGEKS
ncbi:MAG: carbamoyltransferase [Candidatus Sabulitectum sp.]|nr:carbamoyltransferase [Candidatus Sabulitectum sp.]